MVAFITNNIKLLCVLGILVGLALCAVVYQTIQGLEVTGLSDFVSWGLYVVNFTFCLGLGAGILVFLSILSRAENISYGNKFLLSFLSFITLSLAGIFILVDLGRLDRFYYMMIYPQPKSPLFWDFISLNVLIGISVVFCLVMLRQIFLTRGLRPNASRVEQILCQILTIKKEFSVGEFYTQKGSWILVCVIAGVYLLTTELFSGLKTRPLWHTPLLNLSFLISAVLSGVAAIIFLGSYCPRQVSEKVHRSLLAAGRRFLLIFLLADLFFLLVKHIIDHSNPFIQGGGTLFPASLFVLLVLGNIIPIYLILIHKKKAWVLYRYVPILVLVGILLKRADIIIPAYSQRWLPFAPAVSYAPSLTEIVVFFGIYSAGIIAVMMVYYFTSHLIAGEK